MKKKLLDFVMMIMTDTAFVVLYDLNVDTYSVSEQI